MNLVAPISLWLRVRRAWDRVSVYLPLVLMGLMAMTSYWLVRNTPVILDPELEAAPRHVPDYFMHDFSVRVFGKDGKLKTEMKGVEGRHYPDTDTLEVLQIQVRIVGQDGRTTLATANRGVINADASEAQLFEKAIVVREAVLNKAGQATPRIELRSEFFNQLNGWWRARNTSCHASSP